jgi:hypothetical protein
VAFLQEFLDAGFTQAEIIETTRNLRTRNEKVVAAHVKATR